MSIKEKIINFFNILNLLILYINKILTRFFNWNITKNGNPMTNIKLLFTILTPLVMLILIGFIGYQMLHHTQPITPINNTNIPSYAKDNIVKYTYSKNTDIINTPYPTIEPNPTNNPTATPAPTPIVTTQPTSYPLPTPLPQIISGEQYISEHNFVHVNGLNTDYKLVQGQTFKRGKPIVLNFMVQNLKTEKITSLSGYVTVSAWAIDNKLLQPYLSDVRQTIVDADNLNLREMDTYKISQTVNIPSNTPTGSYLIIVNINADNQASLTMQQIIQVI